MANVKLLCAYCGNIFEIYIPKSGIDYALLRCDRCNETNPESFKQIKEVDKKKYDY